MRTPSLAILAIVLISLGWGCAAPEHRAADDGRLSTHSVVVIGIDTLRADFLSAYGFPHPISPHIDALASEGALFTDVVTTSPWTLPSFASLLSGQYPSSHGAGARTGPQREGGEPPKSGIRSNVRLMPEILRNRGGFETALFFDNPYLGEQWGLAEAFDDVRKSSGGGKESVASALAWIRRHREQRFFVFLHLMEPHLPYEPPEPFRGRAQQWFFGEDGPPSGPAASAGLSKGAKIEALYAGEVAYVDSLVGSFVAGLRDLGLLDETVLIVTSDHGEEFYEHEEIEKRSYGDPREIWGIGHGHSQFQELLAVPLILRFPGEVSAGVRIDSLTQIHDLAPTILEWQGIEVPESMYGKSLVSSLEGEAPRSFAFSEFMLYGEDRRSFREGPWKLILGPDEAELYDLASDPNEVVNLRDEHPDIVRRLARELRAIERRAIEVGRSQGRRTGPETLDEETREELRALGYLD